MKEFQELASTQHMFAQAVSTKIFPSVCLMTSTSGPPSLEIVSMKPRNCSLTTAFGLDEQRELVLCLQPMP